VRAGDHEDADGAHHGVVPIVERQPGRQGDEPDDEGDVEQEGGGPVGQRLSPGA
jgi:hypothetical protein